MTGMSDDGALHVLMSAAAGAAFAAAGVYAVPADPKRHEMDRALLRTAVATAAACAWALWRDEVGATLLSFVVATYLLGEVRLRRLHRKAPHRKASPRPLPAASATATAAQASSSPSSSPSRGSSR